MQTKTRISTLLAYDLANRLKDVSKSENITQSFVVESALRSWFKNKLNTDTNALSKMSFEDLPSEDDWLNLQSL